ncbi:MAG: N-formylglutamate amidohydrolase [Hyphomicrobiaceae bacterium]
MPASERASILAELTPGHTVSYPRRTVAPVVLCSPHSGRSYTKHFLSQSKLDPLSLRRSEDCFVDELFGPASEIGVPMIAARFPRAYLDVNREPFELDPVLFGDDPLPDYANTQSVRVTGGLGTIARVVADGENIYKAPISVAAAQERIQLLYQPFHAALSSLLSDTLAKYGTALLLDCHSMPSTSTATTSGNGVRPDIVIGDRFGAACASPISGFLKQQLTELGYNVHMNRPYAGGYITEHYGRPSRGVHAVQLEINRGLYLDESRLRTTDGFASLQTDLRTMAERLFTALPDLLDRHCAAAE